MQFTRLHFLETVALSQHDPQPTIKPERKKWQKDICLAQREPAHMTYLDLSAGYQPEGRDNRF